MIQFLRIVFIAAITLMGSACTSPQSEDRIGFEQARQMFASRGVQPGQPLPQLSLVDLNGAPASIQQIQDRALVLVTCSLTCNVARRQQRQVDDFARRHGRDVAVVMIYTIDAHPSGDVCPYTGKEWVPKDNRRDKVLVRQPTTIEERLALARQYQDRFGRTGQDGALVLVDTMDNASWQALGQAPNLGLLVDGSGTVRLRQGWFDGKAIEQALKDERGL